MSAASTIAQQAQPSRSEFLRLAADHTLIPISLTLTADLETPVTAFLRLAGDAAAEPECFLLESVEGGEKIGRYTFIGLRPYKTIVARGRRLTVTDKTSSGPRVTKVDGDIFEMLKDALSGQTPARLPGLPPFTSGAVGFFSYDSVRQIEQLPARAKDELGAPDATLMFFDEVVAFDHIRKEILLIVTASVTKDAAGPTPERAYEKALARLEGLRKRLARPLPRSASLPMAAPRPSATTLKIRPRTPKKHFLKAVARAKEYIAAGDIFQVVLSQRFDLKPRVDPFSIYRALRIVNPSPYMYFLRLGNRKQADTHIVGSSPELLVRVAGERVEYRPIAGTRPRGATDEADQAIAAELLADEKERAEHVMLVDLGRNDVGRVSEYGSVRVADLMRIERYSHVMHIVSSIEGRLRAGLNAVDAFRACFPAGTLSGAPKIRAMEIIEELEPARRAIYGGSIFYADFSGNLDSCIAIRTLLMQGRQGYVQAGAGIVADSVAEREYEECLNKASAVLRAIERARG